MQLNLILSRVRREDVAKEGDAGEDGEAVQETVEGREALEEGADESGRHEVGDEERAEEEEDCACKADG